jgi:hypothetical protein
MREELRQIQQTGQTSRESQQALNLRAAEFLVEDSQL